MGDTKDPPGSPAAGPSAVQGTLASMKETFDRLVTTNSGRQGLKVFGGEVMKEWRELSGNLQPGSKLEDRSSVLAFVVRHCYILLDTEDFVGYTGIDAEHKALVKDILAVLHVCMDDHPAYKPMPCNCFQFYGDCLAAMDVFAERAWSLRMTVGSDVNAHLALAGHLQFEMKEAIQCMSRCWSVLRSKGGTLIVSPATGKEKSPTTFEADMRNQISSLEKAEAQDAAMVLGYVGARVKQFCKLALSFICVLSCNMLEGMGTTAKLWVDKQALDEKFNACITMFGGDKKSSEEKLRILKQKLGLRRDDQWAKRTWETLRGIFDLVVERHADAIKIAKVQNAKSAKQIPGKKLDEKLKMRLGSGTSSSKLKSSAAEVLFGGHKELFSAMWESDTDCCHNIERDDFADSASCFLFSVAPFDCAMPTLIKYWHRSLWRYTAGLPGWNCRIANVESRVFVEDMSIKVKSRKEKIKSRDDKIQEHLLQNFADDEKMTEGKRTPKKTAGPQSPAGPGQKDASTSERISKSQAGPLSQEGEMETTQGPLKSPQALPGDPTREELEQAEDAFVSSCSLAQEMKVLLQNVAEVEEHARTLKVPSEKVHLLGISWLCGLGLHFSTGHSHPDPKLDRFTTDLPELVEFLAEAGLKGSYKSLVREIRHRLKRAQNMVAHVTDGENNTVSDLKDLGWDILRFTIAVSQLSKVLLQNTQ